MKDKVIKLYDRIEPSDALIQDTLARLQKNKRRKNRTLLFTQCGLSVAAAFAVILLGNKPLGNVDSNAASIFAPGSAVLAGILLAVVLCTIFIIHFLKKK